MRSHRFGPGSVVAPLAIALAGVLAATSVFRGLFDPDYFWHVATGRLITEPRVIPRPDPLSFTWAGEPWVPDQWLADLFMVLVLDSVGAQALLALFGISAALGLSLIAGAMRREGVRDAVVVTVTLVGASALLTQVTARPQVASFLFLGAVVAILVRARPDAPQWLFALPPLFLVWANTHGFYIVGLGVGAIFLAATFMGSTPMGERRFLVLAVGLASLLASLITPQGLDGLLYAASFGDTGDWGARNIAEWQSPDFHDLQFLPFLVLIASTVVAGLRRVPPWLSAIALVGMALGLLAIRLVGVGSILMIPALMTSISARFDTPTPRPETPARRWLEIGAASVVAVTVLAAALARPVAVDDRHLPVAGTAELRRVQPGANVLARYGWGGYVIHELYASGGRVFVDGRMHKYAPEVIDHYSAIVNAEADWEDLVERYDVEAMLLRVDTTLVKGIAQAAGWCEVYRDELQVLLMRACDQWSATSKIRTFPSS